MTKGRILSDVVMTDKFTQLTTDLQADLQRLSEITQELAQVLQDYELVTRQTWEKKRREALKKAKQAGVEVIPF